MIPSKECLELRAKNLSFQLQIWTQATKPFINVPEPKNVSWEDGEHGLRLTPDTKNNLENQAMLYKTIMKKCRCKKKQCRDKQCVCRKDDKGCSTFCECLNCCNTGDSNAKTPEENSDDSDSDSDAENDEPIINEEMEDDIEALD